MLYAEGDEKLSRVPYWLQKGLTPEGHRKHRPDYGFLELVSLFVVRDLRRSGLKLGQVRAAERYLEKQLGHPRPFATEAIYSDGANVFYDGVPDLRAQITAADLEGQEAMRGSLRLELKGVGYTEGVATSWEPTDFVKLDPQIQFGEPCVASTRVGTRRLKALAGRGVPEDELAADFDLEPAAVRAALAFEERLAEL